MKFSSRRTALDIKGQISTLEYMDAFSFSLVEIIYIYPMSGFGPKGISSVNKNG